MCHAGFVTHRSSPGQSIPRNWGSTVTATVHGCALEPRPSVISAETTTTGNTAEEMRSAHVASPPRHVGTQMGCRPFPRPVPWTSTATMAPWQSRACAQGLVGAAEAAQQSRAWEQGSHPPGDLPQPPEPTSPWSPGWGVSGEHSVTSTRAEQSLK